MAHPPATLPVKPPLDRLELIFVGADWVRKGGDIAVEALARLRADGIDAHFTLVGGIPERLTSHPGVTVAGFLDKSRPRDADRLSALYAGAHAMVLPTRGDCTPMVIAEAMAHGAPVLVTDTGATTEMLGGAGAGRTLSLEAGPAEWARAIADLIHDPAAYDLMSDAAFDRARTRFSWETWASQVARIVSAEIAGLARAA